jgi:hypothetical protein
LRVDGIIGATLMAHFLTTLDYPKGELVLRRMKKEPSPRNPSGAEIEVPIYLAGDHLILAHGRVNQGEPWLLLVDTGLAGGGFTCPKSTIHAANITSFFGPFPESLEHSQGFRIGGWVSHAFFRPFAVTFDFAKMKLILASNR